MDHGYSICFKESDRDYSLDIWIRIVGKWNYSWKLLIMITHLLIYISKTKDIKMVFSNYLE